ncbi:MAG: hypothetical protein ABSA10_09875, partial [Anaerolineales bacterium]
MNKKQGKTIVGIGWYKREEWELLLSNSIDRENMHNNFDEWEIDTNKRFQELIIAGINVKKIAISVPFLLTWCKENKLPVNGSSKAKYIVFRTQQ